MSKPAHPDFWGREGRGGEEWNVVDRPSERGDELGGQGFEKPHDQPAHGEQPARREQPEGSQASDVDPATPVRHLPADELPHGHGEIAAGDEDGLPDGPAQYRVPS